MNHARSTLFLRIRSDRNVEGIFLYENIKLWICYDNILKIIKI